jgi:hypothetical protein
MLCSEVTRAPATPFRSEPFFGLKSVGESVSVLTNPTTRWQGSMIARELPLAVPTAHVAAGLPNGRAAQQTFVTSKFSHERLRLRSAPMLQPFQTTPIHPTTAFTEAQTVHPRPSSEMTAAAAAIANRSPSSCK